jgi:predicted GNAT family acetyltransferase
MEERNLFDELMSAGAPEGQPQASGMQVELAQGIDIAEVQAAFMREGAMMDAPYKVYQMNSRAGRYYYRVTDAGKVEWYPSVTTILRRTQPTPEHLIKWIADLGYEEAERIKMERAAYGTFMHAQFEKLIISRTYVLDDVRKELSKYIEDNDLPSGFIAYEDELKKDVLSFAQWMIDYDVRPIAVEVALVNPDGGYAGMVDLVCDMKESPKSDARTIAIVDFKSGKKGFHEEYEIQLGLYREMWNVNFKSLPVERIFNFAPKDWRKTPTYTLKEQTDSKSLKKIPYILALAAIEDDSEDKEWMQFVGHIDLDEQRDLTENINKLKLSDVVIARRKEAQDEK